MLQTKVSDDQPQWRARWVAQEFRGRGGDRHEYVSEIRDLTLVKAVTAHAAERADESDTVAVLYVMAAERTPTLRRREGHFR